LQHTTVGKHPVAFDPNPGGGYLDPVTLKPIPQPTIDKWVKEAQAASGGKGGSKGWQQKTLNGTTVVFNPNDGNTYLPEDRTHPLSSTDIAKLKSTSAADVQQFRAQAHLGIQSVLQGTAKIKANPKAKPEDILRLLVAQGIPNWIAVRSLLAEAANHKGQDAWTNFVTNWGH
jgi:hypothetical protein